MKILNAIEERIKKLQTTRYNGKEYHELSFVEWNYAREFAVESGDLIEIAALAALQLIYEEPEKYE